MALETASADQQGHEHGCVGRRKQTKAAENESKPANHHDQERRRYGAAFLREKQPARLRDIDASFQCLSLESFVAHHSSA